MKPFTGPSPIYVFVTMMPTKKNGLREEYTSRVGTCREASEIAGVIAKDRAAMRNTFGGLIDPGNSSGRSYRAFKAEWTELKI